MFTGLCEKADRATLACIERGNAEFEAATRDIERSCGPAPSVACRLAIYDAMEVGDECGERLLAFELLLQQAARERQANR